MKKIKHVLMGAAALAALVGCDDNTTTPPVDGGNVLTDAYVPPEPGQCHLSTSACVVTESISGDTTWSTGATITLSTRVYVTGNATLTIQPGVTVKGALGSALVVTRGSHLVAEGTAAAPIVFTSSATVGTRQPADWGGIVLFGRAPTNQGADVVFEGLAADERHTYGGTDEAWDCGSLRYVRVEFGGQLFSAGREFNGITVAGCGSETQLSYIQIHKSTDDGIEFFGGSANMDHAVITADWDDGLDYDFGWHGNVQYLIVDQSDLVNSEQGIEADNNATGVVTVTPRSRPTVYNATFLGAGAGATKNQKIMLRRGAQGIYQNIIFQQFKGGLHIEPPTIQNEAAATFAAGWPTNFVIEHSFLLNLPALSTMDVTAGGDVGTGTAGSFDTSAAIMLPARANTISAVDLITVGAGAEPEYCPAAGQAAATGTPTPPASFVGFDTAGLAYAGACAPGTTAATAWYHGWTAYPTN